MSTIAPKFLRSEEEILIPGIYWTCLNLDNQFWHRVRVIALPHGFVEEEIGPNAAKGQRRLRGIYFGPIEEDPSYFAELAAAEKAAAEKAAAEKAAAEAAEAAERAAIEAAQKDAARKAAAQKDAAKKAAAESAQKTPTAQKVGKPSPKKVSDSSKSKAPAQKANGQKASPVAPKAKVNPEKSFRVGQKVSWTSGAGGYQKKKVGEIVAVVPANTEPFKTDFEQRGFCILPNGKRIRLSRINLGGGSPRNHVSYVVMVPNPKSPELAEEYYWPRTSGLSLVD